ncbi:hypothetical protein CAPTEDRAFT_223087 [Capitella teleta]|uniref:GPI ethanolamine phosphate transferase 3, catalytic subunit n=1 Tax=Capitella teleta TaxID=283909 RepID=R7U4W7_CAPTE|nr:hypothetical protein CAPTEDRAFT_223087 [Capitella teleta]|eukprot:ELT98736.1 hypothetical protein CAPTEDRAFT_223087 [Capitella teleta]
MEGHRRYILAVIWLCVLYVIGILLFTQGFLLSRAVVSHNNTCRVDFAGQAHNHLKDRHGFDGCWMHARFKKAVILIIDALRFDFVAHQELVGGSERPFQNKLVSINKLLDKQPMNSRLYRFIADPPTTTMQRLKGLTTGSLPTFVDASANFASAEISEDNIIQQMENQGKRVVFTGDDTWMGLYPTQFLKSFPFPSLNVKDLHTVDNGVIAHLNEELQQKDEWDILIGHTLGVDHCGHTYGPDHPIMEQKLKQMDDLINNLTKAVDDDTVLLVFGDHGMTKTGDHGGDSKDELNSALFVYSKSQITSTPPQKGQYPQVSQIDLVPTLSLLLGLPIPHSNLGSVVVDMFNHCPWWKTEANPERQLYHAIEALHLNAHQVHDYLLSYNEISSELPLHEYSRLDAIFRGTETELQSLMVALHHGHDSHNIQSRLKKLTENYMHYLSGVKEMCEGIWAKFNVSSMVLDGAVNWSFIVLWGLLCSERFFSTGHHATITAIRWEAAFNGFQGDFSSNLIPALLIGINTYASYILGATGLPLLLFWPYVQGKLCFAFEKAPLEENQRGEFLLNEEPERLHRPLFRLFIGFLLFFAIKLLFCMACAALHRRHLMVWKIFAPRFIYEGLTFLVMSMLCVLVYCAVVRVDGALNKWTDRIRKSQSS